MPARAAPGEALAISDGADLDRVVVDVDEQSDDVVCVDPGVVEQLIVKGRRLACKLALGLGLAREAGREPSEGYFDLDFALARDLGSL